MHLGIDRVGGLVAYKKPLVEADQQVHLVVGIGLALASVVAFFFGKSIVS